MLFIYYLVNSKILKKLFKTYKIVLTCSGNMQGDDSHSYFYEIPKDFLAIKKSCTLSHFMTLMNM